MIDKYKRKWTKTKNHLEHRYVWENNFGKIPEGLVVHHIDEDKKNNNINNLSLMTSAAHNRIHSHPAWNKNIKAKDNKKWSDTIDLAQSNRKKSFIPKFKESFELQLQGKKLREIALIQGISRRQVSDRIKSYKEFINKNI